MLLRTRCVASAASGQLFQNRMNIISAYLKKWLLVSAAALGLMASLTSCDSVIYDDEGDCSVTYRLKFRYDRNMLWADAFANEVKTVRLYAFSKNTGLLAWQHTADAADIAAEGMTLDLPAGDYTLLTWCSGAESATEGSAFTIPDATPGRTRIDDLTCGINIGSGDTCRRSLPALYHGRMDVTLPESEFDRGDFCYTMPLTKDTKHVRIILQHLSGEKVNPDDFVFTIKEDNGLLGADNRPVEGNTIVYGPYHTGSASTDKTSPDAYPTTSRNATISTVSTAIADLSLSRLMADRKARLTITTNDGEETGVTDLSLTEYALMLMDGLDRPFEGKNELERSQDYLDRQDEYALVFFLDENNQWIATSIIINEWKIVLNNVDFS